jgi:hypothetical protein
MSSLQRLSLETILPVDVWERVRAFVTHPQELLHVDDQAIGKLSLLQYYYALGKETAKMLMAIVIEGCECVGTETCESCLEHDLYDRGVLKIRNHRDLFKVLNISSRSLKRDAFTGTYHNWYYINMLLKIPQSIMHMVYFPNLWSYVVTGGDSVLADRELTRGVLQTCRGGQDRVLSLSVKGGEDSRDLPYPMMETEHVPERVVEEKNAVEEEEMDTRDENVIVPTWTTGKWTSGDTLETETDVTNGYMNEEKVSGRGKRATLIPAWTFEEDNPDLTRDWTGDMNDEKVSGGGERATLIPIWTFEKENPDIESI